MLGGVIIAFVLAFNKEKSVGREISSAEKRKRIINESQKLLEKEGELVRGKEEIHRIVLNMKESKGRRPSCEAGAQIQQKEETSTGKWRTGEEKRASHQKLAEVESGKRNQAHKEKPTGNAGENIRVYG